MQNKMCQSVINYVDMQHNYVDVYNLFNMLHARVRHDYFSWHIDNYVQMQIR